MTRKLLLTIYMLVLTAFTVGAQTSINIHVGHDTPYVDHLALQDNANDMDLMVKFIFDEAKSTLTVSLISYRSLFVFRDDTPYKPTIKWRKIRPERLPYVAQTEQGNSFKLTRDFCRSLYAPKSLSFIKRWKFFKKYVFKRWITYEGLQLVPTDYKMVNDYIEQTFNVPEANQQVKITLGDVMMMRHASSNPKKKGQYEIFFGKDLNRTYYITIDRDPCFNLAEEIAATEKIRDGVAEGYETLKKKYGNGIAPSKEYLDIFNKLKELLTKQYTKQDTSSTCPTLRQMWKEHNAYVDSIAALKCTVAAAPMPSSGGKAKPASEKKQLSDTEVPRLLAAAHQIDRLVSRWLLTNDKYEKKDIANDCRNIILRTNRTLRERSIVTPAQKEALRIYREAENHFNINCVE